ncbi:MAG TPA: hypothetical protein VHW03_01675 [Chthoniobacterales bacterium]|jgi:hypothetical protein|nr:hypothetical protein [Chthoniobacterales bacterium]
MKKKLIISALTLAVTGGLCFGQGLSVTAGNPKIALPAKPTASPPVRPSARGGVIFTAVRNGNPIQMLNPAAPARYGNAQDHVVYDPQNPGKPKGIKLFEWTF